MPQHCSVLTTPTTAPVIPLWTAGNAGTLQAGRAAEIVGWGQEYFEQEPLPEYLKWADTVIQSPEWCDQNAGHFYEQGELCTIDPPSHSRVLATATAADRCWPPVRKGQSRWGSPATFTAKNAPRHGRQSSHARTPGSPGFTNGPSRETCTTDHAADPSARAGTKSSCSCSSNARASGH